MVTRLKPYNPSASDLEADWHVVDADGQVLGRLTTHIATMLMGKHKPEYVPHLLSGDFVVVINAQKLKLTGAKWGSKLYRSHTLYPGGLKEITAEKLVEAHPDRLVRSAVWGMLPKGRLGRKILKKLKIFGGADHAHSAQKPEQLAL